MGIARQLKDEIFQCPPVLVITGRPQDAWLATWSRAEGAVSHPIDPIRLAEVTADCSGSGSPRCPPPLTRDGRWPTSRAHLAAGSQPVAAA